MKEKKRSKTKMMFVTFIGLGIIAAAVKVGLFIQEKIENNKNKIDEDYYG